MSLHKYSTDTHPLIWYFQKSKALSRKGRIILEDIFNKKAICYISSIVLLEALHVSFKLKKFNFKEFISNLKRDNIIIVSLDKKILPSCYKLPKNLGIHDRIITATALVTNSILITKDSEIEKIKEIKTIW